MSLAIGCPRKDTRQLVCTVELAKCRWINVDISLPADPRLPQACSPQRRERWKKKEVLKCQSDLPPVRRQEHGGNMESWGFSRLNWNEAATATLNLFEVPFCSFGLCCCLALPHHHWLPSGQRWKMESLLAQSTSKKFTAACHHRRPNIGHSCRTAPLKTCSLPILERPL